MKVLFLAGWYPNKSDPQNGVFVKKHAKAVSQFCEVNILFTQRDRSLKQPYIIERQTSGTLTEWIVCFSGKQFQSLVNTFLILRLYKKMIAVIRKEKGMEDLQHIHILDKKTETIAL